jgi:hypothetical protein
VRCSGVLRECASRRAALFLGPQAFAWPTAKALTPSDAPQPIPGLWSLDILRIEREPILKGLHHSAQGCAPRATLGVCAKM